SAAAGQLTSGAYLRGMATSRRPPSMPTGIKRSSPNQSGRRWPTPEGTRRLTWRIFSGRGDLLELTAPERARPLLDLWRQEVDTRAPVSDPTRRPLEWGDRRERRGPAHTRPGSRSPTRARGRQTGGADV